MRRSDSIRNSCSPGRRFRITVAQKSELRVQCGPTSRSTTAPPGTEFLDAETKRQKSSFKRANARRDENPRIEWPEISAKTPYFASYRKRAVCKDWVVVEVVSCEPVSGAQRELTGQNRTLARFRRYGCVRNARLSAPSCINSRETALGKSPGLYGNSSCEDGKLLVRFQARGPASRQTELGSPGSPNLTKTCIGPISIAPHCPRSDGCLDKPNLR